MMLFEIKFLNTFGYLPHTQKKKMSLFVDTVCKMTQFPFDRSSFKSTFPIQLIHTDVWDQARINKWI